MKINSFQDQASWLDSRRMKITGSRLKDIVTLRGNGKKIGFWELVAERLATAPDGEDPMERGSRLEGEAMERFKKETGKEVNSDLILLTRDDNENIAVSPDGIISETEMVEIKCLSSARHLEAWITKSIPNEYEMQVLQYFIVNDALSKLHFVFYDPRIQCKDYFVIEVTRDEVQEKVDTYHQYQVDILKEVEAIVNELSF